MYSERVSLSAKLSTKTCSNAEAGDAVSELKSTNEVKGRRTGIIRPKDFLIGYTRTGVIEEIEMTFRAERSSVISMYV